MALHYNDFPEVATQYANHADWQAAVESGYEPTPADYEEMAEAQLEGEVMAANIETKRRLRDQLDRAITDFERSMEVGEEAPW